MVPDSLGEQLADRGDAAACESCHTVDGWRPSTFGVEQHATLDLPLDGRHVEIACGACHGLERDGLPNWAEPLRLGSAGVGLTMLVSDCVACHRNPHLESKHVTLEAGCLDEAAL